MDRWVRIATAVTAGIVMTGCAAHTTAGGSQFSTSDDQPASPHHLRLPTGTWTTDGPMSAAMLQGVLVAGRDGCVYVGDDAPASPPTDADIRALMVWPAGFTAVGSFEEGLTVLDPDGREVARTGDHVDLQGGGSDRSLPGTEHCTDFPTAFTFMGGPAPAGPSRPAESAVGIWQPTNPEAINAESTVIDVAVTRLYCAGGRTGTVLEPEVIYEANQIVIRTDVAPLPSGAYDCQGNDSVPLTIQLREPVGFRQLVDVACLEGQEPNAASTSWCADGAVRWRS